jgi:hypothetical protein
VIKIHQFLCGFFSSFCVLLWLVVVVSSLGSSLIVGKVQEMLSS